MWNQQFSPQVNCHILGKLVKKLWEAFWICVIVLARPLSRICYEYWSQSNKDTDLESCYSARSKPSKITLLSVKAIDYLYLQGTSHWTGHYELALTDRHIRVRSCLKVILEFWDYKFLMYILGFQKSAIGWPQQPLTERI